MARALRSFCVLILICIGIVTVLCVAQQMQGTQDIELTQELNIIERFQQAGSNSEKITEDELPPLVEQAEIFALYLNSPEPNEPNEVPEPATVLAEDMPAPIPSPPRIKPQFRIVGMEIISYYYLRAAESRFLYKAEVALEEFLEMAGASIVLYGTTLCAIQNPEPQKTTSA